MAKVTLYTMEYCPYCKQAKALLTRRGIAFEEILVPDDDEAQWDALQKLSGMRTMPQIFHGDRLIGGYQELSELDGQDALASLK
ncbi:MAG TPA: glutaredoxin domain-containing protein [Bdellovibrionota bacterium]|nr:glutaredoxin domain-containing protein [Bdellovibrionota bacterium]